MLRSLLVTTFLFSIASPSVLAVDLRDATNRQILDELAYRLATGGGGLPEEGASVSYTCDLYNDFLVSLVGPTGQEATEAVSIRNSSRCAEQVAMLHANQARISAVRVIGVCDVYGDLRRLALTPAGDINQLSPVSIRNYNRCLEQARQLNDTPR